MGPITQMSFEFMEWEKVFRIWRENEAIYGENIQLVISTHWATSGYWIEEKGRPLTEGDRCYIGKQVYALEKRVRDEIQLANKEYRGARFTI